MPFPPADKFGHRMGKMVHRNSILAHALACAPWRIAAIAAIITAGSAAVSAQIPTKCLEIESILVDACTSADCPGSTEGMNEMLRFITGPDAIAISDLQFEFYSSSFQGIAQNAATDSLTALLNASITGCGHLLQPPGGIIPPGCQVVFVTSTAMCTESNSFASLEDTLYILFQNPGNSQGHFRNNSDQIGQPATATPGAPVMRWLRMAVAGTGCGDTATYDASQLTNIYGTYGGSISENDGATVLFSWPGVPAATYVNHGCMAPFIPTVPVIAYGGDALICGASAELTGTVGGSYSSVHWQGGSGVFSDPDSLVTSYVPGAGDSGQVQLSFCAIGGCGDSTCTSVIIIVVPGPSASFSWTPENPSASDPEVQFEDLSTGAVSWTWYFVDTTYSGSTEPSPSFSFPGEGCFPVALVAMNDSGCTDTAFAQICISGYDTLQVPNIFSPNGDGVNDQFRVTGGGLVQLELRVFNRWGQQMAVLERPKQSWDGHSPAGEPAVAGTYFYTLRATTAEGAEVDRSGTITLVR